MTEKTFCFYNLIIVICIKFYALRCAYILTYSSTCTILFKFIIIHGFAFDTLVCVCISITLQLMGNILEQETSVKFFIMQQKISTQSHYVVARWPFEQPLDKVQYGHMPEIFTNTMSHIWFLLAIFNCSCFKHFSVMS